MYLKVQGWQKVPKGLRLAKDTVRSEVDKRNLKVQGSRDSDLVSYLFPQGNLDAEVVWLLATHQEMVQELCLARGVRILPLALKERFKERLLMSRTRASEVLLLIL